MCWVEVSPKWDNWTENLNYVYVTIKQKWQALLIKMYILLVFPGWDFKNQRNENKKDYMSVT